MKLGLRTWGLCIAVAAAAPASCNVDPGGSMGFTEHCADLQGDATCASVFPDKPHCSTCLQANQGCQSAPAALVCQPGSDTTGDGPDDTTGGMDSDASSDGMGTTIALDSSGGESTGEGPCAAEGEIDETCVARDGSRPYCVDAVCVGCEDAGGDGFCGDLDLLAPACDVARGSCVPCDGVARSVCEGSTPVCGIEGACEACVAHDQCPGSACHLGPADPLLGECFAPDEVIWVDNESACPGDGSEAMPMCSFAEAVALLVPGASRVLRVQGGTPYAERGAIVGDITVAIIGDDAPRLTGAPAQQAATLAFDGGATGYISGVRINDNPLTHGLACNGSSTVLMESSELRGNAGWGVFDFEPCTLEFDRTLIVGNDDGGVRLSGGTVALTNATVGLNGQGGNSTGVRLIDAEAHILYSTIAGNDGTGADSIQCDGGGGTLRNSIAVGADGTSIELDCFTFVFEHSAIDAANFAIGTNVEVPPYDAIQFSNPALGDFGLAAPPLSPFGGIALWQEGDPETDADGSARPTDGSLGYAGIDEP